MSVCTDFYELHKHPDPLPLDEIIPAYHTASKGIDAAQRDITDRIEAIQRATAAEMLTGKTWGIDYQNQTWKGKVSLHESDPDLLNVLEYDNFCGRDSWYRATLAFKTTRLPQDVQEEIAKRTAHLTMMLEDLRKAAAPLNGYAMLVMQRESGYIGRGMILHDD